MEYYSAIKKNSFESVLMRWMKLEPIIQVALIFKHQFCWKVEKPDIEQLPSEDLSNTVEWLRAAA